MVIISKIQRRLAEAQRRRVYASVKDFTMVPEWLFCQNLALAETAADIPGCIVECGVWRGGMSAGLCRVMGGDRQYFLLDSFEGLPPAKPIDGPAANAWQRDTTSPLYYDNCSSPKEFAQRAMKLAGASHFKLIPGFFEKTVPLFKPDGQIAILRLDGDWYDSTMQCLVGLFDKVADGGLIIFDDYYAWDGCSRAVHDFLSQRKSAQRISAFADAVCYIRKRSETCETAIA